MKRFKIFTLSALSVLFISKSGMGMETSSLLLDSPTPSSIPQTTRFGSWFDLKRAQDLFEDSNFAESANLFSKLWTECQNLIAFGYLKEPALQQHVDPNILEDIAPFSSSPLARENVKISNALISYKRNQNIKTFLKKIPSSSSDIGGRAFYEQGLLEEDLSKRLNLYKLAALKGEMRACLGLKEFEGSLDPEWQKFAKYAAGYEQMYLIGALSPGDYELKILRFARSKLSTISPSSFSWPMQAAHMGNKEAVDSLLAHEKESSSDFLFFHMIKALQGSIGEQSIFRAIHHDAGITFGGHVDHNTNDTDPGKVTGLKSAVRTLLEAGTVEL